MLLAGRQRQHPAPVALGIERLAGEAAGHLADEFLPAGEQPDIGAAEAQRVAQRLALRGDDIGPHLARRAHQAERDDLGDRDDEQRAGPVAGLGERRQVVQAAEEVGVLDHDAGGPFVDRFGDRFGAAVIDRQRFDIDRLERQAGLGDGAVMRMEPARQHDAGPS